MSLDLDAVIAAADTDRMSVASWRELVYDLVAELRVSRTENQELRAAVRDVFVMHGNHDGEHNSNAFKACDRCIELALVRRKRLFDLVGISDADFDEARAKYEKAADK